MKTPDDGGGPGVSNLGHALAIEALARLDAYVAVISVASHLPAAILAAHATPGQHKRRLRAAARGDPGALSCALT